LTARRIKVAALVAVACLALPAPRLGAQRLAPSSGPAHETPSPTVAEPSPVSIRINAVVTDSRGRPLVDLKPGDFRLDDNGVTQSLSSVELRKVPAAATAATPIASSEDERKAAQDPGTRVFALFLDEFNIAPGVNSARVREAASRFVTENVRPNDLLYILKPMAPLTGIRFTRDRTAARAAIDGFEGRKGDYEPRTAFETQYFGRTPAAVDGARTQIITTGLRELTMAMGELRPARGALILISEGFVKGPGVDRRRLPDWQSLARAASHFNLPIYTFDPRDPAPDAPAQTDRGLDTLQSLATQTGGEAITDARDIGPGLTRVSRDLDSYYVLTYQPSQATDGRFHPIAVTIARKDVQIRVPSGYWSPLSSEWRTWLDRDKTPPGPPKPVRALRRSRLIDTWYGFERGDNGRLTLVLTWESTPVGAALRARPQAVLVKVSTTQGSQLFEQEIRPIALPGDGSSTDRALVEVPAGRMQVDLSIRAADGSVLDTSAIDIDTPSVRGAGPVILQPQIVRARTARDFRTLVAQADAAPTPARSFSRSERLLIRVPAYNPDGSSVTASVAVSNIKGETIRKLDPLSVERGIPQFDLPLAFLAPGDYGIEITVTSATGTARQLIRFRLPA
jgi:VWFA-related protein